MLFFVGALCVFVCECYIDDCYKCELKSFFSFIKDNSVGGKSLYFILFKKSISFQCYETYEKF